MTSPLEGILRELGDKFYEMGYDPRDHRNNVTNSDKAISTALSSIKGLMPRKAIKNKYDQKCEWTEGFNACLDELNKNLWGDEQ